MTPYAQAGIMLHPAAELRNAASTTPYLAAGRCGLPSTTWVPPSDRLAFHLDHRHPAGQTVFDSLNSDTAKSGQHHNCDVGITPSAANGHDQVSAKRDGMLVAR